MGVRREGEQGICIENEAHLKDVVVENKGSCPHPLILVSIILCFRRNENCLAALFLHLPTKVRKSSVVMYCE